MSPRSLTVRTRPCRSIPFTGSRKPGFATRNATHAEIHNIIGLENSRATYDGLLKLRPDERPFVLTRATYCRWPALRLHLDGRQDSATWNHLRLATQMVLNLSVSGISMVGGRPDVGGFGVHHRPICSHAGWKWRPLRPLFRDHCRQDTRPHEISVNGPAPRPSPADTSKPAIACCPTSTR